MLQFVKDKVVNVSSGFFGGLSFLGGYNICHNACLALIASLSFLGISVQGMPLFFLQGYAKIFP